MFLTINLLILSLDWTWFRARVINQKHNQTHSLLMFRSNRLFTWAKFKAFFGSERSSAEAHFAKFGKDSSNPYRAEYEKEVKERTDRKLNWNIGNRWEQRELDDIYNNSDIRSIQYKDFAKQLIDSKAIGVKQFNSVDEIYFYVDNMFTDGISENILVKALDIFIRDANQFNEKDLENPTFKKFLRELSQNFISFSEEESYLKAAQFLDMYCINDNLLWVNLELFTMKKDQLITPKGIIKIMSHFSRQLEGSKDFYYYVEHQFYSGYFDKWNVDDFITLGHNYYLVQSGTVKFYKEYSEKLMDKMDASVSTFNILRVMQSFSAIGTKYADLFNLCEYHLLKRYDQLMPDEAICAATWFSIAGQGSALIFKIFEKIVLKEIDMGFAKARDTWKAFIISSRGSNEIFKVMEPRIRTYLDSFSTNEKWFILNSYFERKMLSKVII